MSLKLQGNLWDNKNMHLVAAQCWTALKSNWLELACFKFNAYSMILMVL